MAHKTKINGTIYDVNGGSCKVNGTKYNINKGRTKINGVGYDITFSKSLSSYAEGDIIYINEGGSPVEFYVAKHDYESELNGTGRTLVVRKKCYNNYVWNSRGVQVPYDESTIDTWLNTTYKNILDITIQSFVGTTKIIYDTSWWGDVTTEKSIFILSLTELGEEDAYAPVLGSALPIADILKIAYLNGVPNTQWTRTISASSSRDSWMIDSSGAIYDKDQYYPYGSRPAFTLPSSVMISGNGIII